MGRLPEIFISFMFYSFLGWCFEMIHMSITTKEVVNRGFFNGPIVPIYGTGGLLVLFLLKDIKSNVFLTIMSILIICTVLEYLTSYLMEKLFKMRWWDYQNKKFNINGRVCLETMLMFLCLAIGVLYVVDPIFSKFISTLSNNTLNIVATILLMLFASDATFSGVVLKKYMTLENKSARKDKTPAIREFTWNLIRGKL